MDSIHTEVYKGRTIEIHSDSDPENPREAWDNMGTLALFAKRYTLGDKTGINPDDHSGWDAMEVYLEKQLDAVVILPVYMYSHSGITISTSPFSCPWDSGQIGFAYLTRKQILKEYGGMRVTKKMIARATSVLEAEVRVYDQYLKGEVYGYTITEEDGSQGDSCWGYYGDYDGEAGPLAAAKECIDLDEKRGLETVSMEGYNYDI